MRTADFDYTLPIEPRDHSRLLVLHRADGSNSGYLTDLFTCLCDEKPK